MKKKILLLLLFFLLTGCWNYRELNDLAIVSALGISKKDDKFQIYIQIMLTKKEGGESSSSQTPITVLKSSGKTIHEAYRKASLQSTKELYLGHTNIVIIDEEMAKEGLDDVIDFLIRDPESRKQFNIMLSPHDDLEDVLGILTPIEKFPASDILETIKVSAEKYGSITPITYDELVSMIYSEGIESVIPGVTIIGDREDSDDKKNTEKTTSNANILLTNLGVFKQDKFLGYLGYDNSIAYNLIKNNKINSVISARCDSKNFATLEIETSKSKIKLILEPKLKVKIEVKIKASLSEINCAANLSHGKDRSKNAKLFEKRIESMISSSIDFVQNNYESDIFGFGELVYIKNPKKWKELKPNWDKYFKNLDYDISVDINFVSKGSTLKSIKEAHNESRK